MQGEIKDGRIIVRWGGESHDKRAFLMAVQKLEGSKRWLRAGGFSCANSAHNIRLLSEAGVNGLEAPMFQNQEALMGAIEAVAAKAASRIPWQPTRDLLDHQQTFIEKAEGKPSFALFADMGTGKTKMAIDLAVRRWTTGLIDAVIVVAIKGVHYQWLDSLIDDDLQSSIKSATYAWDGKTPFLDEVIEPGQKMPWVTLNYDAAKIDRVQVQLNRYFKAHSKRIMLIVDESHKVKNPKTKVWKAVKKMADACPYVMLLTGTPITKDLIDYWGQFKLLDESIIGIRYLTTFRAEYCIMGGYEMRQVVAHKNEERLYAMTEPYTFRVTKDEALDLPPKTYEKVTFVMDKKQQRVFDQMKATFIAELDGGVYQTAANAAVAVTRLHQITCGYIPDEEGNVIELPNPRLKRLNELIEDIEGKVVIWCRYNFDIELIAEALGEEAVTYYGATSDKSREKAKREFINPDSGIRFMVSNPAAGGTGVDGYQKVCSYSIYYSNSFSAEHRWQSEDRIHRTGMSDKPATYIDLICKGGVDNGILSNLRAKRSMSNLMLDDIRRLFDD